MTPQEIAHHPFVSKSMLCYPRRTALARAVMDAEFTPGDICEFGSANGGSASILRLAAPHQRIRCYDTWNGLTEPSEHDVGSVAKKGDSKFSVEEFTENCKWMSNNFVSLNACAPKMFIGDVMQSVPYFLPQKIAFAFLDLDLYDPTRHVLQHIRGTMEKWSCIVVDDYSARFPGVVRAVDSFNWQSKKVVVGSPDSMIILHL